MIDSHLEIFIKSLSICGKGNKATRLEIMRFLAKEAREEKNAKTYNQIVKHFKERLQEKITLQAVRKHCEILKDIGIIAPTRSKSHDPSSRGGDYISFYFVDQSLITIVAILAGGMTGLDREGTKRIRKDLNKEVKAIPSNIQYTSGIYAHGLLLSYLQSPAFDTLRNIVHNYIQLQKDIVNSWPAAAEGEFNRILLLLSIVLPSSKPCQYGLKNVQIYCRLCYLRAKYGTE
jgi:DNA-binding transcriptional ArsR family regulator